MDLEFSSSLMKPQIDEGDARLVPFVEQAQVSTSEMKDPSDGDGISEKNNWTYSEMKQISIPSVDDGNILANSNFPTTFSQIFQSLSPLEVSKETSLIEEREFSSEQKPIKAYLSARGGRKRSGRKSAVVVRDVDQCDTSKICPPSSSQWSESTCDTSKQTCPSDPKKPMTTSTPRVKKPKLYESDGPEARNARAAKANRERQKQRKMQTEKDLATKTQETVLLQEKLAVLQAADDKRKAEEGLRNAIATAGDFLEVILRKLQNHFSPPMQIELASWFHQVPMYAEHVKSALRNDENVPKANLTNATQPGMSTSFILYCDPVEGKVRINYDPNQPRPADYKPVS